tara:strand:- start:4122 stop:4940 length:819 start_codon:yes stop_codon:yes gene_type:complete
LYTYGSKKPLFDRLDLDVAQGNIYGLLGKNGAGKSTLLKIIAGLLFPKGGEIQVLNHIPSKRDPNFLNQVFLLTEEFDLPAMTIDQYIRFYGSFYPDFGLEQFTNYLGEFKLISTDQISGLSYGQKKKFMLSFGLATNCKLLILDEPTNGLDIPSKSQFRKVVASAMSDERTFIISTHQVRDMEGFIDPIIILDEGEIVLNESMESITNKLKVVKSSKMPELDSVLYSEGNFGSYLSVEKNDDHSETNMALELLFNTVTSSKVRIHEIFKQS